MNFHSKLYKPKTHDKIEQNNLTKLNFTIFGSGPIWSVTSRLEFFKIWDWTKDTNNYINFPSKVTPAKINNEIFQNYQKR